MVATPKSRKRRSQRQEREIACERGGYATKQSGAGRTKGDVRNPMVFRLEAKYTTKKSFRIDQAELAKIRGEASGLEMPLFEIHFVDPKTNKTYDRWILIDGNFFGQLRYEPAYSTPLNGL